MSDSAESSSGTEQDYDESVKISPFALARTLGLQNHEVVEIAEVAGQYKLKMKGVERGGADTEESK